MKTLKMNHSLEILIFIATVVVVSGLKCDVPVEHYKTMKCTPVGGDGSACPTRFECPSITNHNNSLCYFNGKTYNINQVIPNKVVTQQCATGCQCKSGSQFAQFSCSPVKCPQLFADSDYGNCIYQNEPNECCPSSKLCGDDRRKLPTCILGGNMLPSGMRMSPAKCIDCICHEGFDENNLSTDPYCFTRICPFELFNAKQVYAGAAPVYFQERCCPWEWRMPKSTDQIAQRSTKNPSDNSKLQCKYGNLIMNIGDTLVEERTTKYTYKCSCLIPPLAQCVMTKN